MTVNEARIEHEAMGHSTPFDPSSVEILDLIKRPHAQTRLRQRPTKTTSVTMNCKV